MAEYIDFGELEPMLTCAICLETFIDPRMLDCAHTYCLTCLETLVAKLSLTGGNQETCVKCPSCRIVTTLPPAGIEGLKINFLLNCIQNLRKKSEDDQCGLCIRKENPVALCQDCNVWLCHYCRETHPITRSTKDHKITAKVYIKVCVYMKLHKDRFQGKPYS